MYTSMNFLQRHKNHYCSPRTLNWECRKCKKQFTSVSSLNMHIRQAHADEKRTQSTQSDKAFIRCNALTKHLRTHTGETPYQCTQCNKAFNNSSHLTTHLRTHTGEKPYQCTQCSKAFNNSSDLTTHLRTHTGEKSYQCTQCNKAFSNSFSANLPPVLKHYLVLLSSISFMVILSKHYLFFVLIYYIVKFNFFSIW